MAELYDLEVEQSLMYYISRNVGETEIDTGPPVDFDPDADGINEWMHISVPTFRWTPGRTSNRDANVTVVVEYHTRDQDDLYAARRGLKNVVQYLDSAQIEVTALHCSDVIGHLRLFEPNITNISQGQWQSMRAVLEGAFEEQQ